MKVGLIHYSAPPVVGGVESVLAHHARLMADAGLEACVLAGRGEAFDERIPVLNLPMVDSRHEKILAIKRELDKGRVPAEFEKVKVELVSTLRAITNNTDVLVAHNVCSLNKNLPLTAALYQISQEAGSPHFILWHHDLAWTTPRYRSELHDGYPWNLLRCEWPGATQVVVSEVRRSELSELIQISPRQVVVVPNGLDLANFLKLEERTRDFISRLDLLAADPLLLLPVRITPRKNIEMALQIVAALCRQFPRVILIVTGPLGPHNPANVHYYERLRSLREELNMVGKVHFLAEITREYLPDSVIFDFYRLADALLMPSREEGFGIPILEAGMAGLPVFCADIPPLRELAGDRAVYFSPDADAEEVAAVIGQSLSMNPVHQLRVKIRTQFSWERLYKERIEPLLYVGQGER
jgi:glycosyltransferase involved in cell wall biosynthesis